mmetsp:Transcript_16791/g.26191  ORF Transcript_16791/g.26191 Transcript_16791/m.26191 type:complete len:625 (-) Transcript_16791:189-2063(-)|eukprot:CAMPEP_0196822504 /NCGR_PEP_ID=MMETSP1362-20130617/83715_1 /TAXON_ID=163516 /ORGANISM="Leptocylindrus danicus, Strain CCMP1856" /LENGTH=624 /DNA_ID=CAMNT_0042202075 /DNA_START=131 /DNA_END=2005 /DNA_ORIENTATION=+
MIDIIQHNEQQQRSVREQELEARVEKLEKLIASLHLDGAYSSPTSTLRHPNTLLSIMSSPGGNSTVSSQGNFYDSLYMDDDSSDMHVVTKKRHGHKKSTTKSDLIRFPDNPVSRSLTASTFKPFQGNTLSAIEARGNDSSSVAASSGDDGAGNPSLRRRQIAQPELAAPAPSTTGIKRVMASPALKPVASVLDYVKDEMTNRHKEGRAEYDSDVAIQEFLRVPFRLEPLLMFGLLVCVDCFLYVLTFLPLKFIWSMICLCMTIINPRGKTGIRFHRRHFYHVIQIAVIVSVSHMLNQISIGRLYHWIRGQSMIKLYVIVAIVDVFDRLLISFGKDALDSLYWNINRRPYHPRSIVSVTVVLVYAAVHSLFLFVHAATINVAMNSADSALMSLLVSSNFAEIKSTVFKKYQKKNLFDITAADINERFKLLLFLILILILNICQGTNKNMLTDFTTMGAIVLCGEIVADWIKHCFITKLNFIKSNTYIEYGRTICMDITGGGHEGINMDHTHAVVRRVGLAQIPLACVMVRYLREAAKYSTSLLDISNRDLILLVLALFVLLFIGKICLGIIILKLATLNLSTCEVEKNDSDKSGGSNVSQPRKVALERSISLTAIFNGLKHEKVH